MASYNKVLLMGNITRDIELKHTPSNQSVATIGLAVNRRYSVGEGANREQREEVTFVDCEAWGRTAEIMSQYLAKGRPVFIEGRLKLDTWQDKETGGNRSKLKVVIESFQFVDSRTGEGGGAGPAGSGGGGARSGGPGAGRGAPRQAAPQGDHETIEGDDIPF